MAGINEVIASVISSSDAFDSRVNHVFHIGYKVMPNKPSELS
jgi:hypothetical protein